MGPLNAASYGVYSFPDEKKVLPSIEEERSGRKCFYKDNNKKLNFVMTERFLLNYSLKSA